MNTLMLSFVFAIVLATAVTGGRALGLHRRTRHERRPGRNDLAAVVAGALVGAVAAGGFIAMRGPAEPATACVSPVSGEVFPGSSCGGEVLVWNDEAPASDEVRTAHPAE
jgi:hypothetical protein